MFSQFRYYIRVFRHSLLYEKSLAQHKFNFEEVEFLPSVLNMQESPPSPIGRVISWTIIAFFIISVIWATFGKVDVVTMAQGKIIHIGKSKIIQPIETGKITAIHVYEGKRVKKGEVLIELDPSLANAEDQQVINEQETEALKYAAQKAILQAIETDAKEIKLDKFIHHSKAGNNANRLAQTNIYVQNQINEYRAKKSVIDNTILQRKSELKSLILDIERLDSVLPLLTQREATYKKAVDKKIISENEYLALKQERVELTGQKRISVQRIYEIKATINRAISEKENLKQEFKKAILIEQNETEKKLASLEQEYKKSQQKIMYQSLTSPTDGVVQQLSMHTIGGVVTPAQELMVIVPLERNLEIEAWVENKDIGFIEEGMKAEVKVESFPFTKYGVLPASVKTISNDAVEIKDVGFVFQATVILNQNRIKVSDTKYVNLSPGMNVTVEIKTGQRRVIEYFLTPIIKGFSSVARER